MAFDWSKEAEKVIRAIDRAEAAGDYYKAAELVEELRQIQEYMNGAE